MVVLPGGVYCGSNAMKKTLYLDSLLTNVSCLCHNLCNPHVVSLLDGVSRPHCFGLIYTFTCTIIINVYNVRIVLMTKQCYTIRYFIFTKYKVLEN